MQSPTGGSGSATYSSSQASSTYLPQSTMAASGNKTSYTYDGQGNQLSSDTGTTSNPSKASIAYNTTAPLAGTVKSATAPGNANNPTTYGYDGNNQLSSVTPPTNTTLGVKNFTYDAFGRLASETDGNGNTTTFTYDKDDRQLTEAFSDGTETVENTYDGNGNLLSQDSDGGYVTNTYDATNRQLTTQNSIGGGTISYVYDKAGNEISSTDRLGRD